MKVLHVTYSFAPDPMGGTEVYVADLCRRLVERGHRVDLYAASWAEGAIPAGVRVVPVSASGPTRRARLLRFPRHSEAALLRAEFDCSVGFINTWHHDVLIPQGGVPPASLHHNALRFPAGWRRALYTAGKRANPLGGIAYAAAKFGMRGMATALAAEEKANGIRVSSIFPGEVNTPILEERPTPVTDEHRRAILQPEDVAAAVLFVCTLPPRANVPELIIKPTTQAYF